MYIVWSLGLNTVTLNIFSIFTNFIYWIIKLIIKYIDYFYVKVFE